MIGDFADEISALRVRKVAVVEAIAFMMNQPPELAFRQHAYAHIPTLAR